MPTQKSHLERLVQSYSTAEGLAPGRVRRWLTTMVMIGALDRVPAGDTGPLFLVKGGVAMELRLRHGARATNDLDMVFRGDPGDLIGALDRALAQPYGGFSFIREEAEPIGPTSAIRLDVRVSFSGRSWATSRLEIAGPEGASADAIDIVEAIGISDFGLTGPDTVSCLSLRYQIAQKLHACTEVFDQGENARFRDLIDLILLRALADELGTIQEACQEVFALRDRQTWPPALHVPRSWVDPYARLAAELAFEITDADMAAEHVRAFIDEIAAAPVPQPPRDGKA